MAWNVILLMGGGFALAEACKVSILSVFSEDTCNYLFTKCLQFRV